LHVGFKTGTEFIDAGIDAVFEIIEFVIAMPCCINKRTNKVPQNRAPFYATYNFREAAIFQFVAQ
jgi:hypothetical protein